MTYIPGSGPIDESGTMLDYAYEYIDASEMAFVLVEGTPNVYRSLGAGAADIGEVSVAAAEQNGVAVSTADELYWKVPIKGRLGKFNLDHDIQCRLHVETGGNITPTGADFRLAAKGIAQGEAFTDAKSSPDVSIIFPLIVTAAGAVLFATPAPTATTDPWIGMNAAGLFVADLFLMFALTCNSDGDAAADQIRVLGVELRGTQAFASSFGARQIT